MARIVDPPLGDAGRKDDGRRHFQLLAGRDLAHLSEGVCPEVVLLVKASSTLPLLVFSDPFSMSWGGPTPPIEGDILDIRWRLNPTPFSEGVQVGEVEKHPAPHLMERNSPLGHQAPKPALAQPWALLDRLLKGDQVTAHRGLVVDASQADLFPQFVLLDGSYGCPHLYAV
jgi:hypothetical protein